MNPIVYCDLCDTGCHQKCYGIDQELLESGKEFVCDLCVARTRKKEDLNKIYCEICHKNKGMMKLDFNDFNYQERWFHPFCVILDQNSKLLNLRQMISLTLEKDKKEAIMEKCSICKLDKAINGQKFHHICAWLRGARFELILNKNKFF